MDINVTNTMRYAERQKSKNRISAIANRYLEQHFCSQGTVRINQLPAPLS